MNEATRLYFQWLKERVHAIEPPYTCYETLLLKLYSTPAAALIESDSDRLKCAKAMRLEFQEVFPWITEEQIIKEMGPVSLFELGFYLARYTNSNIIRDESFWNGTHEIFWEMMNNIGIDHYTDRYLGTHTDAMTQLGVKLETLNERTYDADGTGNWFRLDNMRDGMDMRQIALLQQSWAYVNEGQGFKWSYNNKT